MNGILNLNSSATAYGDALATTNPKRRFFDWSRNFQGVTVSNPKSEQYTIDPSATLSVFSGTRSTSIDGTTQFSVTQSTLDPSRFRFTATAGTLPAFRVDRAINAATYAITFTVNTNASVSITAPAGAPSTIFSAVQPGDTLLLPGLVTGDSTSPFDPLNAGYWTVIGVSTRQLTVVRPNGQIFSGATQTATVATNSQFVVFGSSGVQIGDKVEVISGFSSTSQRTYAIVAVAPTYFEVLSTIPIAIESGIVPTASGLQFYKFSKRFLRVECDQEAAVQVNGDTGQTNRISPFVVGDSEYMGWYEKLGPAWSLSIVNRSSNPMNVSIFSAE